MTVDAEGEEATTEPLQVHTDQYVKWFHDALKDCDMRLRLNQGIRKWCLVFLDLVLDANRPDLLDITKFVYAKYQVPHYPACIQPGYNHLGVDNLLLHLPDFPHVSSDAQVRLLDNTLAIKDWVEESFHQMNHPPRDDWGAPCTPQSLDEQEWKAIQDGDTRRRLDCFATSHR
jgi:hypothetical protein